MNKWGVVAFLSGLFLHAQSGFEPAVYTDRYGDLPYRILLPENSSTEQKYPLIVVLHGAGERGKDNRSQLKHGSNLFLQQEHRTKYPAIVVFPQCPKEHYWATILERSGPGKFIYAAKPRKNPLQKQLIGLIKKIKKTHAVDTNKIYVGGGCPWGAWALLNWCINVRGCLLRPLPFVEGRTPRSPKNCDGPLGESITGKPTK